MELLIDTPFPALAILTLWRLPYLLRGVVSRCNTARERRKMVLVSFWQMLRDVPMAMMSFAIVVTVWRIPSLVRALASLEVGDDEHRVVRRIFVDLLADIPSALRVASVCLFAPWRIFELVSDMLFSPASSRGAAQRREMASDYFWVLLADWGSILVFLVSLISLLRLPVFVFHLFHQNQKPQQPSSPASSPTSPVPAGKTTPPQHRPRSQSMQRKRNFGGKGPISQAVHRAAMLTASAMLLDGWVLFMISFILCGVFHVVPMMRSIAAIWRLHRRRGVPSGTETPETLWDWSCGIRQRNYYEEPAECPVSFTLFEPAISGFFFSSIRDLPHVPLLPLKALAPILFPVFVYIGVRFDTPPVDSPEQHRQQQPQRWPSVSRMTSSFVVRWARSLRDSASKERTFWQSHMFSVRMLAALVLVLANELAVCLLAVNGFLLFLSTLGFPLWKNSALAQSPHAQNFIRSAVFMAVGLSAPFILVTNISVLLAPAVSMVLLSPFPAWTLAIVSVFWILTCCALWQMSNRLAEAWFEWFSPTAAYLWVLDEFFGRKLWRWYVAILDLATDLCYPLRRLEFLFVGEVILAAAVLCWTGWPLALANFWTSEANPARKLILFVSAQASVFLLHRAMHVVRNRWRRLAYGKAGMRPVIELTSLVPMLAPESKYGFVLEINGSKHPAIHVQQARLILRGRDFWASLSSAMGPFWITVLRHAFHPFVVIPTFMDPAPLSEGVSNVSARFVFGTEDQPKLLRVSRRMLRKYLEKVVRTGDPWVEIVMDYGERSWGLWVIRGRLVSFRLKTSALLDALWSDRPVNLLETGGARITETSTH